MLHAKKFEIIINISRLSKYIAINESDGVCLTIFGQNILYLN